MQELLVALSVWASALTGLPPLQPGDVRVHLMPPAEIEELFYAGSGVPAENRTTVIAIYNRPARAIVLPDTFDPGNLYHISALLHEAVHAQEHLAGVEYPCPQASEKMAYDAQIRFLEAAGVDALATMKVNDLFLMYATTCMRE